MIKDLTYQKRFEILKEWLPTILESVKRDIKQEHLQKDPLFLKNHFPGKNLNKLTLEEMVPVYERVIISEGNENIGEFVAVRWLLKNTEVYQFFESRLQQIDPNFDQLNELQESDAQKLKEAAVNEYGAVKTYLFSLLNAVVFPEAVFQELKEKAHKEKVETSQEIAAKLEESSLEGLKKQHELEVKRLLDKYEKKLSGLQKKYLNDVESLKKEVARLQRKLVDVKA